MEKPSRAEYSAAEILDWAESNTLILTPKFQRRGVWQQGAKSFFIDTLLRQMPIPPIYIRLRQAKEKNRIIREVVDGQQRLAALTDFMRGEYALAKSLPSDWRGKTFEQLSKDEQTRIEKSTFATETFQGISDQEVLEVFSRLNTYSVPLNAQELRNGRYFGPFKQFAYETAHEYLEFWRTNRIFTERGIARMEEVELVSELVIAGLDGMQDKKNSIDDYYAKYDESFPNRDQCKTRFDRTMATISEAFTDALAETEFHRSPLFYTLYTVAYHRLYGLPGIDLQRKSGAVKEFELQQLVAAVVFLSDAIEAYKGGKEVSPKLVGFVSAAQRQTDNIKPRQTRFTTLYKRAFQ